MRKTLALAALAAAAAAVIPLQSASAYCTDLSAVGGPSCYNPCKPVNAALAKVGQSVDCFE